MSINASFCLFLLSLFGDEALQEECRKICDQFPDILKPELGKLKDLEREVQFNETIEQSVFCKPPFSKSNEAGTKRGIWECTHAFNAGCTALPPVRKAVLPGQSKLKLRVCVDYSVRVNPELEPHRQPMTSPETFMERLRGGNGFRKAGLNSYSTTAETGPAHAHLSDPSEATSLGDEFLI
ncbi:hypothetical protein CAPTEDRAFT_200729 [Capitella teleta]|uniref:Secreted protein n=1 Tax=Capitella teleta TaxID=283909 RepID=R7USS2_CAPTE|nr:hypothetical protein CAPTEDRAFT_200729 [Capitella teleta]|eukprot:ELU09250.1 hypothetical protein CAPTEDRAFT_200729 [Capitella teleta]